MTRIRRLHLRAATLATLLLALGVISLLVKERVPAASAEEAGTPVTGAPATLAQAAIVDLRQVERQRTLAPTAAADVVVHAPLPLPEGAATARAAAPSVQAPAAPLATSPAPFVSFVGLPDDTHYIPPDTMGAVGPNHVMTTLNSQTRLQDRSGNIISTVATDAFWAPVLPAGSKTFDPHIVYDPFGSRWIFTIASGPRSASSSICIGVSRTSDPTGLWNLFRLDADATDTLWLDYPMLGFNKDWIVVSAHMFSIADDTLPVVRGQVYAFTKANLYANISAGTTVFTTGMPAGLQPAVTYDNTLATEFLIRHFSSGGGTERKSTLTGPVGSPTLTVDTAIVTSTLGGWSIPSGDFLPQSGTTRGIDIGDARVLNAVVRTVGGQTSLWFSQTIALPAGGSPTHAAAQWWQVDAGSGASTTVLQQGRLEDPTATQANNGNHYAYATLAVNKSNDVLLGFTRFSLGAFPSSAYALRLGTDPAGTLRGEYVTKSGQGCYIKQFTGTRNRWGDYSSTVVDPVDDTSLWTVQEFADTPVNPCATTDNGRWSTMWAAVSPLASLTVNKVLVPANDPGKFNLQIDGATAGTGANVGNGGTTGAVQVIAASHTVGETAVTGTNLVNYTTVISGDCAANGTITLAVGDTKTCTITNTVRALLNSTNGHYYEKFAVSGAGITWSAAKTMAESKSYHGMPGHLVTVTSAQETNFLVATFQGTTRFWMGGSQLPGSPEPAGGWTWITGEGFSYTNWNAGEPNNGGGANENALEFLFPAGTWNDRPEALVLPEFVVEYEAMATLTVNKVLTPASDAGKFNLQVDAATAGTGATVGNGGTTGAVQLIVGAHTVGETAGTGTSLADYTTVIGGDCAANGTITLAAGDNKTCTVTNTRKPKLTMNKVLAPAGDSGKFNLQIDGATAGTGANVGNGGTTGAVQMGVGAHTVGETAGTGTILANYTTVIGGDCAVNGAITLAAGDNKVCTITNTRNTFNAARDFNPTANPAGAWRYGWSQTRGAAFNMYAIAFQSTGLDFWGISADPMALPNLVHNGTNTPIAWACCNPIPPGALGFHPGAQGQNSVVRWTADISGTYRIAVTFTGADTAGTTTDVAVLLGGTQLFSGLVTGYQAQQSYSGLQTVLAGQTIDFTVGFGSNGNYFSDSTLLDATITRVDGPAALTVNKVLAPAADPGKFNLQIDGATAGTGANAGNGGTTGAVQVAAGAHTVGETAMTGTNLADYTAVIGGDCAANGAITLAAGDNKTCTITNTRASGATSITVVSGNGAEGTLDPANEFTLDGGTTWQHAYIPPASSSYSVIPGTRWINRNTDFSGPQNASTRYRTTFTLPAGYAGPSLVIKIFADNVATVLLNGTQIGKQTDAEISSNFQDPPATFTANDPALFHAGSNTVYFDIYNYSGPTGFDYTFTVTFTSTQTATLTVTKVLVPASDSGKFNLQIDGATAGTGANAGNGGTTGAVQVAIGAHTVGETAVTGTTLANYTTVISGDCAANGTITLAAGDNKTCTITNTRKPTLTVNKVLVPATDAGKFNLQIDGATAGTGANAGNGGTTGAVQVTVGSHTVGETAGTGAVLANYTTVIGGDCAANGSIILAAGDNKTCTITNTRVSAGTVTRTPWQMWRPATYVSPVPDYSPQHGDARYYGHAPAVPSGNDPGWTAAPDANAVGFAGPSRLTTCWTQADFTFFQTFLTVPTGVTLNTFTATFSNVDDGARITVFNSSNPTGIVIPGSYVFLGGSLTVNLAPYAVTGDNRVLVTQVDDCSSWNSLSANVAFTSSSGTLPTLTVNKVLVPASDAGKFNLTIDGTTAGTGANAGNGGTTGAVQVAVGAHTVGETAMTGTSLANYTTVISGDCAANGTITLAAGDNKTCTITNTRKPTLTVNKVLVPSTDAGKFNLQIDGATAGTGANVGNGGTTGAVQVTPGAHTVAETAGTGTSLADYTSVIGGDCAANGTITLAAGDNKTCTFTNTRVPTLTIAPTPIAAQGSLAPNATVNVTVTAKDGGGNVMPNAQVYLKFVPGTGGGSAKVGATNLSSTPQPFTANANGAVAVTYTAPAALPFTGTSITDTITAQNAATNPAVSVSTTYTATTVALKFDRVPIAANGTLAANATVSITLAAFDPGSNNAIPGATVSLAFTAATGGGSAKVGTTSLTSTPQPFTTNANGQVVVTYTTPATLPSHGMDALNASSPTNVLGTFYSFATGTDSASIISVAPPSQVLPSGKPFQLQVTLSYNLALADNAVLALYVEQYPDANNGCTGGGHHTNGGTYLPITRGQGQPTVAVSWFGDTGSGYVTLGINFWTDGGAGQPVPPLLDAFGQFPSFCYPFRPSPATLQVAASPIAATGSLAPNATVNVTVTAKDTGGIVIPGAQIYLKFVAANGGGSAKVGTTPLSGTPQVFTANANGVVTVTYAAPATLPSGGTDTLTAQDAASNPTVTATDTYTFRASKTTTFDPTTVNLKDVGSTATITVQAANIPAGVDAVQVNVQHPSFLTVTSPACAGILAGGTPVAPVAVTGGTLIGCFLPSGNVSGTTGPAMTLVLTRTAPGSAALTFGTSGGFGTQYTDNGAPIDPGVTNTLTVVQAATSTSFNPTSVGLGGVGSTATIAVEVAGVPTGTDAVQVNIQHPSFLTVTAPACVGILAGGTPVAPAAVTGGTLIGCFLPSGNVNGTTGQVVTFLLTRTGAGTATLTMGVGGGFGTQFTDDGNAIGPGTTNTLQVLEGTTISGKVTLQGRSATFPTGVGHGIATVTLSPGNLTAQTAADGSFQLTGVAPGTYTITASAPGYLSAVKASLVVGSTPVTMTDVQLHAGLVNSDSVDNIQDISATVASFGTTPANRVDSQGRFVDQNGDGFCNIQDISLVVSGFGLSSPQTWP